MVFYVGLVCVEFVFESWRWKEKFPALQNLHGKKLEDARMSVADPIADMLARIRNAIMAGHYDVKMPNSKMKGSIAQILKEEGYINAYKVVEGKTPAHTDISIELKYVGERRERKSVITNLTRVSHPGRRVYSRTKQIPWVLSGLGISIISTPKGVMTGQRARQLGVGGEIICKVW